MFQVVADVERYPEFLPWVVALKVLSRERVDSEDVLTAEMAVGFGTLRETYVSRIVLDKDALRIDVSQTSGPFKTLENHWRFAPRVQGCRVDFSLQYQFRNRLLNAMAGAAFGKVYVRMADAFELRAKLLSEMS